jgi:hypothetical protein
VFLYSLFVKHSCAGTWLPEARTCYGTGAPFGLGGSGVGAGDWTGHKEIVVGTDGTELNGPGTAKIEYGCPQQSVSAPAMTAIDPCTPSLATA